MIFFGPFNLDFQMFEHSLSDSHSFELAQDFAEELIGVFLPVGFLVYIEYVLQVESLLRYDQLFEEVIQA